MELVPATQQGPQAASPILGLPEPVLINILQLLPQHDRLTSAAQVCKSWAAAATAATTDVVLPSSITPATATGLSIWLQQHGLGVEAATRAPERLNTMVQLKLPGVGLAKLARLRLHNCTLEFSNSNAAQGRAAIALPALQCLSLNSCTVPLDTLSLLECPRLTSLQLQCEFSPVHVNLPFALRQNEVDTALSAFLQRLPGLLVLCLGHSQASDAALAQLGCMQQLQECTLWCPRVTVAVLEDLSSSLTSLWLMSGRGVLQEGSLPAEGWPHLRDLRVAHCVMQPVLLSRLTTLERLSLFGCQMEPNNLDFVTRAQAGGVQLLAALAHLTRLRKLDLTNIMLQSVATPPEPEDVAPADQLAPFTALTASTVLESLTLASRKPDENDVPVQPLPPGAVAVLFAPGRQLTALTELVLDGLHPELIDPLHYGMLHQEDDDGDPFDIYTCMKAPDLRLLEGACPNLRRLTLNTVLQRFTLQLPQFLRDAQDNMQQLSYLCLGGLCLTDAEARAVASMRRLRELELHNAPELSLTGLTHLTRMRELSKLTLKGVGCRRGIECALTTDPNADQPNVWQQLERELPAIREQQQRMAALNARPEPPHSSDDSDGEAY